MVIPNTEDNDLWCLEWSPDGITVKETLFPEGKSRRLILWHSNQLRRTTHKTGSLVPVKKKLTNAVSAVAPNRDKQRQSA